MQNSGPGMLAAVVRETRSVKAQSFKWAPRAIHDLFTAMKNGESPAKKETPWERQSREWAVRALFGCAWEMGPGKLRALADGIKKGIPNFGDFPVAPPETGGPGRLGGDRVGLFL